MMDCADCRFLVEECDRFLRALLRLYVDDVDNEAERRGLQESYLTVQSELDEHVVLAHGVKAHV